MKDYKQIVQNMRKYAHDHYARTHIFMSDCGDAADAIEELQAELASYQQVKTALQPVGLDDKGLEPGLELSAIELAQVAATLIQAKKLLEASKRNEMCRLWVKDKVKGGIHEVGTDKHDGLWVDENGAVHYHNLQNGDGASGGGDDENYGYMFVPCEDGCLEEWLLQGGNKR